MDGRRSAAGYLSLGLLVLVLLALAAVGVDTGPGANLGAVGAGLLACAVAGWALWQARQDRVAYERRLRQQAAAAAVVAERLRIARELHDIASHGLVALTVTASVARREAARGPVDVDATLGELEGLSRSTTVELRRMMQALRSADDAPLAPVDDLTTLPVLFERADRLGLQVRVEDEIGPDGCSPGASLAARHVIAEALANVARHAGPTTVRVLLRREQQRLLIEVDDDGPGPGWTAHPGSGHGLIGLRERLDALGGSLQAGPHGPGWRLTARLDDPVGAR